MSSDYGFGKIVEYVAAMAKEDIHLTVEDKETVYKASEEIYLTPLFFRGDGCMRTGKCCRHYTIAFTEEGHKKILEATKDDFAKYFLPMDYYEDLMQSLEIVETDINGNKVVFYCDPPKTESVKKKQCDHLFYDKEGLSYCGIQPVKSITCEFPHSTMYQVRGKTYIRKQQFGRNHQLGCPVEFCGFNYVKFKAIDVPIYKRLKAIADDMKVETYIPELLAIFEDLDKDLSEGKIPTERIDVINHKKIPKQKKLF